MSTKWLILTPPSTIYVRTKFRGNEYMLDQKTTANLQNPFACIYQCSGPFFVTVSFLSNLFLNPMMKLVRNSSSTTYRLPMQIQLCLDGMLFQ